MRVLPSRETKGFKGTKLRVSKFSAFWQPESAISTIRESNVSRCLAKRVEISFFLKPENAIAKSCEEIFRILVN